MFFFTEFRSGIPPESHIFHEMDHRAPGAEVHFLSLPPVSVVSWLCLPTLRLTDPCGILLEAVPGVWQEQGVGLSSVLHQQALAEKTPSWGSRLNPILQQWQNLRQANLLKDVCWCASVCVCVCAGESRVSGMT